MNTLFARLSTVFLLVLLTLGITTLWLTHRSGQNYYLEVTQKTNFPIAMYIAENANLVKDGKPDIPALEALAGHVMMIHPGIEIYMLDTNGKVLASAEHGSDLPTVSVSLEPIERFLSNGPVLPLLGDNPKNADIQSIFSAFPLRTRHSISASAATVGYVYVVLASEKYRSINTALLSSYTLKSLALLLLAALVLALLSGIAIFFMLTRRLHTLTNTVRDWHQHGIPSAENGMRVTDSGSAANSADEIDTLNDAFESMAVRLSGQYETLQHSDNQRRAFFTTVSHDLRTPLTTMQACLETLIMKFDELGNTDKRRYLTIAHKQGKRLRTLITQLFELTRLDSGEIEVQSEDFSLLELAHDCVQDFQLLAAGKQLQLTVSPAADHGVDYAVNADIALLQRVFENLIGNALRYTPGGGKIDVEIARTYSSIVIKIRDTGCGMPEQQLVNSAAANSARFQAASSSSSRRNPTARNTDRHAEREGTGLGLAIVRKILSLHDSELHWISETDVGSCFSFTLQSIRPHVDITLPRIQPSFVASFDK